MGQPGNLTVMLGRVWPARYLVAVAGALGGGAVTSSKPGPEVLRYRGCRDVFLAPMV